MESRNRVTPEETQQNSLCAVLVLKPPQRSTRRWEWYLRPIVGVPFLLLNALHLQAAGATRLVIYVVGDGNTEWESLKAIEGDSRLKIPVNWVEGPEKLKPSMTESRCVWVNGSAVHNKEHVAGALEAWGHNPGETGSGYFEFPAEWVDRSVPDSELLNGPELLRRVQESGAGEGEKKYLWIEGTPESAVKEKKDFRRQGERLLKGAGLGNDSFMDRWLTRPVSLHLTRWLVRTPLTPNQITWMHMVVGLAGAGLFFRGDYTSGVMGAILIVVSLWLDSTDGEVARLRFQQSRFGGRLDIIADNVVHLAIFGSIGWGQYQITGQTLYVILGGMAVLGSLMCFLSLQSAIFDKRTGGDAQARAVDAELADQLANRDFIYFLLVMALLNQLNIFIGITAVGSLIFAGFVMYSKLKPASENSGSQTPKPTE